MTFIAVAMRGVGSSSAAVENPFVFAEGSCEPSLFTVRFDFTYAPGYWQAGSRSRFLSDCRSAVHWQLSCAGGLANVIELGPGLCPWRRFHAEPSCATCACTAVLSYRYRDALWRASAANAAVLGGEEAQPHSSRRDERPEDRPPERPGAKHLSLLLLNELSWHRSPAAAVRIPLGSLPVAPASLAVSAGAEPNAGDGVVCRTVGSAAFRRIFSQRLGDLCGCASHRSCSRPTRAAACPRPQARRWRALKEAAHRWSCAGQT